MQNEAKIKFFVLIFWLSIITELSETEGLSRILPRVGLKRHLAKKSTKSSTPTIANRKPIVLTRCQWHLLLCSQHNQNLLENVRKWCHTTSLTTLSSNEPSFEHLDHTVRRSSCFLLQRKTLNKKWTKDHKYRASDLNIEWKFWFDA